MTELKTKKQQIIELMTMKKFNIDKETAKNCKEFRLAECRSYQYNGMLYSKYTWKNIDMDIKEEYVYMNEITNEVVSMPTNKRMLQYLSNIEEFIKNWKKVKK